MQQFRTLLKSAIAANAGRICITPGERSEWTIANGGSPVVPELAPFDIATVNQIVAFLFPDFAVQKNSGSPITGTLQIPNFGVLKLIAKTFAGSAIIYLYTPAGEAAYASDLATITSEVHGVPAPPIATPKLPRVSVATSAPQVPPPPQVSMQSDSSDIFKLAIQKSVVPAEPAPEPVMPLSTIPSPFGTISAPDFAVSSASGDLPVPLEVVQEAELPPIFKVPDASAEQISFEIPPLDAAFTPDDGSIYRTESASVQIITPTADEVARISFGNQSATEGSVSQGENPIDEYLLAMVKKKASDMHLTMGQPVVFRVHGEIERKETQPLTSRYMEKLLLPIMPQRNRDEFATSNDTDFAYELKNVGRFRVNVFRDCNGTGAVMRHIPSQILTSEQLNLSPAIMNLCKLNKGLVLVTGPTGSGKSTTLAAMVDWINKNRAEHILTIEDPIEFVHPQYKCLVNQREVHKHTKGFSRALKAALREDPDVILIGEMRDLETIAIAIETAETGHLVFGTLHTTTAISTVDRIIDQFPTDRQAQIRTMLASSLRGVVAQTLIKKKGGGRVAAQEVLITNDAVSAMIREGKTHMLGNHMLTQKGEGNVLLNEALFKLIAEDLIDPQEALFKAVDKNDFLLAAARRNIKVA